MQPYQRASETMQMKSQQPVSLLKKAGSLAASAGGFFGGSAILSNILPFLAEGITAETAIAGLTKINPQFGQFIDKALKSGESFDKIKEFISEKVQTAEESKPQSLFRRLVGDIDFSKLDEKTTKELSFLEKISAQLEEKGKDEKDPGVKKLKKKIEKALKGITGIADAEMMQMDQIMPQEQMQAQQQPMQQQGQSQQPGQGQQALMAILQKIQASRGLGG